MADPAPPLSGKELSEQQYALARDPLGYIANPANREILLNNINMMRMAMAIRPSGQHEPLALSHHKFFAQSPLADEFYRHLILENAEAVFNRAVHDTSLEAPLEKAIQDNPPLLFNTLNRAKLSSDSWAAGFYDRMVQKIDYQKYAAGDPSFSIFRMLDKIPGDRVKGAIEGLLERPEGAILFHSQAELMARHLNKQDHAALSLIAADKIKKGLQEPDPQKLQDYANKLAKVFNDLHNSPAEVRFGLAAHLGPEDLYRLLTHGREEAYTSTFNGIFDRMLQGLAKKGENLFDIAKDRQLHDQLPVLMEGAASYNRMGDVFASIPKGREGELVDKFFQGFHAAPNHRMAVAMADTLQGLLDKKFVDKMGAARAQELRGLFETQLLSRYKESTDPSLKTYYGLMASAYAQTASLKKTTLAEAEKFRQIDFPAHYPVTAPAGLTSAQLFQTKDNQAKGGFVAKVLFRDDLNAPEHLKSGRYSFDNFVNTYKGDSANWKVVDDPKSDVVVVQSRTMRNGHPSVTLVANRPQTEPRSIEAIDDYLKKAGFTANAQELRIHSYDVDRTFDKTNSEMVFVGMGSCGGYQNLEKVRKLTPHAQVQATKGTGKAVINDGIFKIMHDMIAREGRVDWDAVWAKAEKKFGNDKDFMAYVPPNKNLGIHLINGFEKAEREGFPHPGYVLQQHAETQIRSPRYGELDVEKSTPRLPETPAAAKQAEAVPKPATKTAEADDRKTKKPQPDAAVARV